MATGSISSAGIGSGLDVSSIISSLMAVERRPLLRLQQTEASMQTRLSAFGQIQSLVSGLRDAAQPLYAPDTFKQTTATTGDATVVTASSGAKAVPGSYAVVVSSLAAAQSVASATGQFANGTSTVGTGTLTIRLGTWDGPRTAFTPKASSADVAITIGAGEDTLEKIRDKINATAGAGVVASIVTDASGARLALTSAEPGAANGFRVTVADTDGNPTDAAGLSRLAYDGAVPGGSQMVFARAAADSAATINGIAVTGTSNVLADVVEGITFTLGKVQPGAVNVSVARSTDGIKAAVGKFVAAYNTLDKLLGDATKYDQSAKQGALLQGDSTAVGLQSRLRQMVGLQSNASSAFPTLSSLGIQLQKDGGLKVDDAKLAASLDKLADFAKAWSNVDAAAPSATGFGKRFASWADEQLATGGPLGGKTKSIQARIEALQDDQERFSDRLLRIEERLKSQYAKLDTAMAKANALQSYVKQQFYFDNDKNDN